MTNSLLYDYVLSPFYDQLAAKMFPDFVHPNFITILGGCFAMFAGILIHQGLFGWAALCFTLYYMMDAMDGKHARRTRQTSSFGGFLDHFIDATVGNFAGYSAFAALLIGFDESTPCEIYWKGFHVYSCFFSAPHVVSHFNGGILVLGNRYVGIDEALISTTLIIFGGWLNNGQCLLPYFPLELTIQTLYAASIIYVCHGFIKYVYYFLFLCKNQPTTINKQKNKDEIMMTPTTTAIAKNKNIIPIMTKGLLFVGYVIFWMIGSFPHIFFSDAYKFWLVWTPFAALIVHH